MSQQQPTLDPEVQALIKRKTQRLARSSAADAREDIEQELALRIVQVLPKFDPTRGNRVPFVQRVIDNAGLNLVRRRLSRPPHMQIELPEVPGLDGPVLEAAFAFQLDVAAILAAPPPLPTEVLPLVQAILLGDSLSQAARRFGIPRSTAQSRLQRLRRRFEDAGLRDFFG